MLRLGICRRGDLRGGKLDGVHARNVSYRLLKYGEAPEAEEVAAFEQVIRRTRLAGGVYRTTYRGRMADVDATIDGLLRTRWPRDATLEVHDWAASDGLAACEWSGRLVAAFPRCRMTASDLTFFLVEVSDSRDETFIFEEGGTPLQYVRPPFVINLNAAPSPVQVVNRWLLRRARRRAATAAAAVARAEWDGLTDRRAFESPPWRLERIPLLHPEAIRLACAGGAFRLIRHSVFDPLEKPVSVIRTMNILNRAYFPPDRLLEGARAVLNSLEEGGIWVVGRTVGELDAPENHATIYEKVDGSFRELMQLGAGSEIAGLVREACGA